MAAPTTSPAPETGWEHFEHVADVGVRGHGASPAEAFEQAALALTAVVCEPVRVRARKAVEIRCSAPDPEILLADWLNAVVFEMSTRRMLFSHFSVEIKDGSLRGRAVGETVDAARHQPAAEIKGATLSELFVGQAPGGGWTAQCILDV
jgi:SHS2 domain-containing protein